MLGQHISQEFDDELNAIRDKVLHMGGLVEQQLTGGMRALVERDGRLGNRIVSGDAAINTLEIEIDEECTRLIARRQPAASDLRVMVTMIKTITDLERIGDESGKLGRFAVELAENGGEIDRTMLYAVQNLGDHVGRMLHSSLDVLARMDAEGALEVANEESKIDYEYDAAIRQLVTYMMEDPRSIGSVLSLLWCARAMERVADHSRNICEYVVYMVKGTDIRHSDLDEASRELHQGDSDSDEQSSSDG